MIRPRFFSSGAISVLAASVMMHGCANLKVSHVTDDNRDTVKGQRYYLPKPEIIVAPNADGTVGVTVDYLPDQDHEYAIDTSSTMSSYTYQVQTDIHGFLTEVEFKADTTALDQQLTASAGASAVQFANYQATQATAIQSAVNTAQTATDAAQATVDAAQAALDSDRAHNAADSVLATDASALAQAQAKLLITKQALDRARTSSQAVALGATAASVATTTPQTIATVIGNPTWTAPTAIGVPEKFAPVVFLVNDDARVNKDGSHTGNVMLVAQSSEIPDSDVASDSELEQDVDKTAQRTFEVSFNALAAPSLQPPSQVAPQAAKLIEFKFDRAIADVGVTGFTVTTSATPPVVKTTKVILDDAKKSVRIDISALDPGDYILSFNYSYAVDSKNAPSSNRVATASVKFTVTK